MNRTKFENEHAMLEAVAHEEAGRRLLMVKVRALETQGQTEQPLAQVAIVIDRSGSMSGRKLEVAKEAAATLIRSLRAVDRVGVVTYDDRVEMLQDPAAPSEGLARLVATIHSGGSTNLYGGWVAAAKSLRPGGRVLLLSDGLANVGPFTDAASLAAHAERSYRKYGIATSTVGIGDDYDEGLMAGMARAGQGFHYFAQSAESIMDAFARERFLMGSLALTDVELTVGDAKVDLGRLLGGEEKTAVVQVADLPVMATLSYVDAKTEKRLSVEIPLPLEYGVEPAVTAWELVERTAKLSEETLRVRSRESAAEMRDATRALLLKVLDHKLADEEPLKSLAVSLQGSMDRLARLAEEYDERYASQTRKFCVQRSASLKDPGKAYGHGVEDQALYAAMRTSSYQESEVLAVDAGAFAIRPPEFWLQRRAAPVGVHAGTVRVALVDPMDGFAVDALAKELGMRVQTVKRSYPAQAIEEAVRMAAATTGSGSPRV